MRGLPLFVRRTSAAANRRVRDRGKPVVSVCPSPETKGDGLQVAHIADWLERVDPGTHRRIKGLRLVTAYGIAALLGHLPEFSRGLSDSAWLSFLAAGFALWASVSEARTTRAESSRDLVVLCAAAAVGAVSIVVAGSTAGTIDRVRRRIIGTVIGVPLGIACLPLALQAPLLVWMAAATSPALPMHSH